MNLLSVILVALGGAAGTLLRWALATAMNPKPGEAAFPWGTLAVNLVGCLAIGLLAGAFGGVWEAKPHWRAAVFVGVLGGFTTFSSFAFEAATLARAGMIGCAAGYVAASVAGGLALAAAGFWITR